MNPAKVILLVILVFAAAQYVVLWRGYMANLITDKVVKLASHPAHPINLRCPSVTRMMFHPTYLMVWSKRQWLERIVRDNLRQEYAPRGLAAYGVGLRNVR